MNNKCGICDDVFDSEESLQKHEIIHINKSILNKSLDGSGSIDYQIENDNKIINLDKIFNNERIEELIESKIKKINNTKESIDARIFIEQLKKIIKKNPFCYLPLFIEDFMNGISGVKLVKKYHLDNSSELRTIVKEIFVFLGDRNIDKNKNALENNLKIPGWEKKYDVIKKNCEFFKDEINQTIFYNMIQAKIIISLMDKPLEKDDILQICNNLKNEYDRFRFINKNMEGIFNKLLDNELNKIFFEIFLLLSDEEIIKRSRKNPKHLEIELSIDNIKKSIISQLLMNENKLKRNMLKTLIKNEYPILKLIPGFGVFTVALKELENEEMIYEEYDRLSRSDSEIFLSTHYLQMQQKITSIDSGENIIPFRGRKITPRKFVNELLELKKGDFNDEDDQVTRLAGLVLAESVKIQSPHEKIDEFDFTMDIKNYQFRPEQIEAIAKLDFKIKSEILHVKVMIDESLSFETYEDLKKKIPPNEQGVIITFNEIPISIKRDIENDETIQIIDEEGILTWVSITPKIPARVNSISKIFYDPLSELENKIVRINSVFYETGIALVNVFPEMNEVTVLARTLEEIELIEATPGNFDTFSENYLDFLEIINSISDDNDQFEAFFKNKIKQIKQNSKNHYTATFENHSVMLRLNQNQFDDVLDCSCLQWADNKSQLCTHLIASLDWVIRNSRFLDNTWNDGYNPMRHTIELFLEYNVSKNLENIIYEIDSKQKSVKHDDKNMQEIEISDEKEMLLDFISKIIKS